MGIQWFNQRWPCGSGEQTIASSRDGSHTFARTDERCPWRSSWKMQWMKKMARWRDYLPSSRHLRTFLWPMLWADTWNVYHTVPSKIGIFTVHLFAIKHVSYSNQTCRWVDIIKDKVFRLWNLKKYRFWSSKWSSCRLFLRKQQDGHHKPGFTVNTWDMFHQMLILSYSDFNYANNVEHVIYIHMF